MGSEMPFLLSCKTLNTICPMQVSWVCLGDKSTKGFLPAPAPKIVNFLSSLSELQDIFELGAGRTSFF